MLEQEHIPIFESEIPRLAAFEKAAAEGVPGVTLGTIGTLRAWQAYEEAGRELVDGRS